MVTGELPYNDFKNDQHSLIVNIKEAKNPPVLPKVSNALENFLKKCLVINPKERSNANELLSDPFLQKSETEKAEFEILAALGSSLKSNIRKMDFQKDFLLKKWRMKLSKS